MGRRAFLSGVGAGVATLAAPPLARARRFQPEIAVVGGGIAGLSCALRLLDRNFESTVYEASGRVGGRMFTRNRGWADGQLSEWGGEFINSDHRTVQRLAARFGLSLADLRAAEPSGSEETYRFFGGYYTRADAIRDFRPVFRAVRQDERDAPFPTLYDSFTAAGAALSQLSIADWINSRVPGGLSSPMGQLLAAAYAPEYGADIHDQSALNLIYLLAFQPSRRGFEVLGESDERFRIDGGNEQLPRRIAEHLGIGTRVKLGHRLVKIEKKGSRYRLVFQCGPSTREVMADVVVLTLPFAVLRGLDFSGAGFDALKVKAITEQGTGKNGKLVLQFQDRIWNGTGSWPGISTGASYSDAGYQSSWDTSRAQAGTSGLLTLYSGGSVVGSRFARVPFGTQRRLGVLGDALTGLAQVESTFPGLSSQYAGRAAQSLPHLSPFFRLSYSYYRRGQYTEFAGYEGVPQGGVYFAGEHTSVDYQGYMEGAASEGDAVARAIVRQVRGRNP